MCILTNIDPVHKLCRMYYPYLLKNVYYKYTLVLIRFIAIQQMVTECARILLTLLIPYLTMLKTFMDILKLLHSRQLTRKTILLYNQLHCINHMVIDICRWFNAMILFIGFVCSVLINWVVLCGWELLGLEIYAVCNFVGIGMYCLMILSLEWLCQLDEFSREVINSCKVNMYRQTHSLKYFVKLVRAQKPVTLYYAMTKFDKETKSNYFNNIVNYTVNAILLY